MIELDTYGYSDHSIELSSDEEGNPEDQVIQPMKWWKMEKFPFQDVLLDVMKRPPVNTHDRQQPIEILEILDSDEVETLSNVFLNWLKKIQEFPICVTSGEKNDNVNIEEKDGIIQVGSVEMLALSKDNDDGLASKIHYIWWQEYIEIEGAGILLSPEFGLVLFHLDHIWYEGEKASIREIKSTCEFSVWRSG